MQEYDMPSAGAPDGRFAREGDYWTITWEGRVVRLRSTKGLYYLDRLLAHPGRWFDVAELIATVDPGREAGDAPEVAERMRKAVGNRIRQAIERIAAVHAQLGRHLENSIRTGSRCAYVPERAVRWGRTGDA